MKLLFILLQLNPVSYIFNGKTSMPEPNFYRIGIWTIEENRINQMEYGDFIDSVRSFPNKSVILTLNNHKDFKSGNDESRNTIELLKSIEDKVYLVQLGNEIDRYFAIKKNLSNQSLKVAIKKFGNDSYRFSQDLETDSVDVHLCLSFSNRSMIDSQLNKTMALILNEVKLYAPNCFSFIDFHHHNHSHKATELDSLLKKFKSELATRDFENMRLIMTENSTWTMNPFKSNDSEVRLRYQSEQDQASFLAKSVGIALANGFEIVFMGIAKDRKTYGSILKPIRFHYNGLCYNDSLAYDSGGKSGPKVSAYLYAIFDKYFENVEISKIDYEEIYGYQLITYSGDQPIVLVWSEQNQKDRDLGQLTDYLNSFLGNFLIYDLNGLSKDISIDRIVDSNTDPSEGMFTERMNESSIPLILVQR